MLRLLLRRGAEVNEQGGRYCTALQAAALHGHGDRVRLLLDHGADVTIDGGEFGSPLQAACCSRDPEIALLLLKKRANVHTQGGPFGSAWHAAAAQLGRSGNLWLEKWMTVLQWMLNRGVDINDARGRQHATALQAVIETRWLCSAVKIRGVRFLLDRGADVHLLAGKYGFPLQSAFFCEREYTRGTGPVEFLLLNCPDINVNAEGGVFGHPRSRCFYNTEPMLICKEGSTAAH